MIASSVKIARGRRELTRRFVPLANAPALFKMKPSHTSIFGGASTEEALSLASKETARTKGLVYVAKKTRQPFRKGGTSGTGKGFYSQKYRYSRPRYESDYQSRESRSDEYQHRDSSRQRNHRRRSRGGRGKSKSRSSRQKDY